MVTFDRTHKPGPIIGSGLHTAAPPDWVPTPSIFIRPSIHHPTLRQLSRCRHRLPQGSPKARRPDLYSDPALMAWLRTLARSSRSLLSSKPSPRSLSGFRSAATVAGGGGFFSGLGSTEAGKDKPRLVVLGTGWAGCRLMKGIDTKLYDVVCISPRNHMVFTPLLASTCVGTLEFRSVAEPVGRIQPSISSAPGSYFFLARCAAIDPDSHTANEILSSFDVRLRTYATKQLTKSGVHLVRGIVKDVQPQKIILSDGTEVPYGLLVWSTGVGPSPFISSLQFPKSPGGRIGVDEWLRVPSVQDVFAIGDCSGFLESTGRSVLPALAQVAERQGKYLAGLLNQIYRAGGGHANRAANLELGAPFVYRHLGSMATVGRYKALVDLRQSKEAKGLSLAGFVSWFIWRSAYLTRVISWRNRFYVAINWATTFVFGRDISRI